MNNAQNDQQQQPPHPDLHPIALGQPAYVYGQPPYGVAPNVQYFPGAPLPQMQSVPYMPHPSMQYNVMPPSQIPVALVDDTTPNPFVSTPTHSNEMSIAFQTRKLTSALKALTILQILLQLMYLIWLWSVVGWYAEHFLNVALILIAVAGFVGAWKSNQLLIGLYATVQVLLAILFGAGLTYCLVYLLFENCHTSEDDLCGVNHAAAVWLALIAFTALMFQVFASKISIRLLKILPRSTHHRRQHGEEYTQLQQL